MEPVDVTKMTVEQLKALAYDTVLDIQRGQNNLQIINGEIEKRKTTDTPETNTTEETS
jgi:hypothetical protein